MRTYGKRGLSILKMAALNLQCDNIEIECKNLSFIYSKGTPFEKRALDDINISVAKGMTTGLIGHTGSGKSTLAMLIAGLLQPSEGSVWIEGEQVYAAPEEGGRKGKAKKLNRKNMIKNRFRAGIIFQYPEYQLFEETVYKDMAYGPGNMGLNEEEIGRRVSDAAEFAGVGRELWEKSPFDLSGGQKRRVAIAGVMAMDPPILILDEPAAGLDPRGRAEILGGLCEYQKITGKTMILISHSMEDMAKYADRIIVLRKAELFMEGSVGEVFSKADLLYDAGLSLPQVTSLFIELERRGIAAPRGIYTVESAVTAIEGMLDINNKE